MEKYRPKTASINKPNNTYFLTTPKIGFQKTFFTQEKDKGDKYFRTTRVGSCRKIVVKNGLPFALTFKVKNPRGEPLTHFNYTLKQLPKELGFRVIRNLSAVDIGNEGLINRKQWISTYKDSFRPTSVKRISNPGILSDMAKWTHYKLNNIEYA